MKNLFFLFLLPSVLCAQHPQQEQFLPWANNLPALPKNVTEVKLKCYNFDDGSCDAAKGTGAMPAKIGQTEAQIGYVDPNSVTMPDTAGIADVQKMTPEQQQEWAMKYALKQQQAATAQPMRLPSVAEKNLFDQLTALNATQAQFIDSITHEMEQLRQEYDAKIKHFVEQRDEMVKVCSGLGNEPAPECILKAERNFREWVYDWSVEYYKKMQSLLDRKRAATKQRFANAESLLVANGYFLNASNESYTKDAAQVQLMILATEGVLAGIAGEGWERGCSMVILLKESYERAGQKFE